MDKPLATFALFAYNQEGYIRAAVEAALAQTYSPLEIILSDDASHDQTFEIMRELASRYEGPHQIVLNRNTTNLGLCGHVNKVFEMARGEWIVGAAGDDISYPDRCQKLHEAVLRTPDARVVTSAWDKIDDAGNPLPMVLPARFGKGRIDQHGDPAWVDRFIRSDNIGVNGASSMWHRRLFTEFGPIPPDVPAEDAVLSFRAYLTGSVVYTPECLMKYRTHSGNICGFNETDVSIIESRNQEFSKRSIATAHAVAADFQIYAKNHPRGCNAVIAQRLVDYSFYLHEKRLTWWDRSFAWRISKSIEALHSRNWVEFRWSVKRLFTKRLFVMLSQYLRRTR